MAIGTNWAEVWAPVWGPVWQGSAAQVVVPDVVGQSQASATTELETVLFVVAVATAYSSTVAAGLVISQSPAAGIEVSEGSTVTITVSLGEAPASDVSGGLYFGYDHARAKREKRKRELEKTAEKQRSIEDAQSREIAELLRAQDEKEAEREDLARIQALADAYVASPSAVSVPAPVRSALHKAHEQRTRNALEQMQREIERFYEEEELAVIAALLMDD